jgi:hypothetical protein
LIEFYTDSALGFPLSRFSRVQNEAYDFEVIVKTEPKADDIGLGARGIEHGETAFGIRFSAHDHEMGLWKGGDPLTFP